MKSLYSVVRVYEWQGKKAVVKECNEWLEYVVECFDGDSLVQFSQHGDKQAAMDHAQYFTR